ncbi:MAG: GNAT family N-acetyltransferase [Bdellovibrionales bacterium]|nr:GNAT family N-acetyltransferase [Bdellovibrionales bacterium]
MKRLSPNIPSDKLVQKASNRLTFVIRTEENQILAIGSAKDHKIKAIYVDPNHFGKGLGSSLLAFLECQMSRGGYRLAELFSSLNSEQFYRRAGYDFVRWRNDINGPAIVMQKRLTLRKKVYAHFDRFSKLRISKLSTSTMLSPVFYVL